MSDLGDDLNAAAGPPEPEARSRRAGRPARRRATTRRAAVVSGALGAVLILGGVAFAASNDSKPREVLTAGEGDGGAGGESTTSSTPETTTSSAPVTTTATSIVEEPGTTTIVVAPGDPDPTASIPATTVPLGGLDALVISGTYTGTEQYRMDSDECRQAGMSISHGLLATLTPTSSNSGDIDGPLTLKSDYCSEVRGDTWTGSGTFALGLPGGETVTGTFTNTTSYPTDGEPYQLIITGGSGEYEGVTGVCDLTVAISDEAFGSQTQSGEFTCDIAS